MANGLEQQLISKAVEMWDSAAVDETRGVTVTLCPNTELGYEIDPRLSELAPHGHWEPGGGIHTT